MLLQSDLRPNQNVSLALASSSSPCHPTDLYFQLVVLQFQLRMLCPQSFQLAQPCRRFLLQLRCVLEHTSGRRIEGFDIIFHFTVRCRVTRSTIGIFPSRRRIAAILLGRPSRPLSFIALHPLAI